MQFFEILLAQDTQDSRLDAQRQNSARLALYRHTHASSGVGPVLLADPIIFDATFLERPHFTQGSAVKVPPDLTVWNMPMGAAGVWQWERNLKGHYIGAYIHLEVRMETRTGEVLDYPHVEVLHDLLFSGVAYKDLGSAATTEAQLLTPRPVNFGSV